MATDIRTTLTDELGRGSGRVAHDRTNSLRLRKHVLLDIAKGVSGDSYHDATRSFFETVSWIEEVPSADSLSGALTYLHDGVSAHALAAVHVLVGGSGNELRFRVNPGEAVGIFEMPVQIDALAARILPPDMLPIYRRDAPVALGDQTPVIIHGCDNGEHDGLITSLWYSFGCDAPLRMPCCRISYELDGPDVTMTGAVSPSAPGMFRRIDRERIGGGI